MPELRDSPYIHATWVAKLLGEDQCQWKAWFKAHYSYQKRDDSGPPEGWIEEHSGMVQRQAAELKANNWDVFVEKEAKFRIEGNSGIVFGGAPDVIAIKDEQVHIVDCKTGQPRLSDSYQVLVYMYMVPIGFPFAKGLTPTGKVQYKTDIRTLAQEDLDDEFKQTVIDTIHLIGADSEPPRVPSLKECDWCDITKDDCPDRMDVTAQTDIF